ncbi:DUF126 domain-containing protein [Castellaniella sp. GW247-6E4]|uniref:aconitase X swivel domain-containing protein n=1 Tax=Castellaniella sp. GW247-6E4 TaxID=3140380 RepID=UPI003314921D
MMRNDTAVFKGMPVTPGVAEGPALVTCERIAFNLGVDERTGVIIERGHELERQCIAGRILVFPGCKGSTASSYSLQQMAALGVGPIALINTRSDALAAAGAVLAGIPLVHRCDQDPLRVLRTGDWVRVDGYTGAVEWHRADA